MQVDHPMKLVWTREEDIQHDITIYRPYWFDRLSSALDRKEAGRLAQSFAGSSVIARWLPPAFKSGHDPARRQGLSMSLWKRLARDSRCRKEPAVAYLFRMRSEAT
jgi:hypothetical protein